MNQQEFESRTGLTPTSEEYAYIERIYMAAGNMDKDAFCNDIKNDKKGTLITSDIVLALTQEVEALKAGIDNLMKQADKELELRCQAASDMADFLIEQAQATGSFDIRAKAISLIGEREYLRRLIAKGCDLWSDDRKALEKLLTA